MASTVFLTCFAPWRPAGSAFSRSPSTGRRSTTSSCVTPDAPSATPTRSQDSRTDRTPMFRHTMLFLGYELRLTLRNPVWPLFGILQPVLYLLLFAPLVANTTVGGT